jgi:hypothetical protein
MIGNPEKKSPWHARDASEGWIFLAERVIHWLAQIQ